MKKIVGLLIIATVLLSSCVSTTLVTLDANDDRAEIIIDGKNAGHSPVKKRMSNAIWENPDILLVSSDGTETVVELEKEIKPVNLVCGLILFWPSLLYVYGPDEYQALK